MGSLNSSLATAQIGINKKNKTTRTPISDENTA